MIGSELSHYRIVDKLGQGGMGEVYRAEDTKLGRDVAIKVLPEAFTADPERLARFEREARMLAALNHPKIAAIYSFETVDVGALLKGSQEGAGPSPTSFLVMELAAGEDLAERIAGGPVPGGEALLIARQIAEALEAAHGKGIVHRDLKPGNVKVDEHGGVKVLDFGLAKALQADTGPGSGILSAQSASMSPTLTAQMTAPGVLLGTASYMSPEQARGQEADKRADIWALGVVLFEMLTGVRAFPGETISDSLAKILERQPDWTALPEDTPRSLRRLLERCLAKDPHSRLRDAGDLALRIDDVSEIDESAAETGGREPARSSVAWLPWVLVAALVAIVSFLAWSQRSSVPASSRAVKRFVEPLSAGASITKVGHYGSALAFSPDGEALVWVHEVEAGTQLFMRRLAENRVEPIPGTEGARAPFFSPDGQWLGFAADGAIKKVPMRGGSAQTVLKSAHPHGCDWGDDGNIIVADPAGGDLIRISAAGGEPELLKVGAESIVIGSPEILPGSRTVLAADESKRGVIAVDLESGEITPLVPGGTSPRYLDSGHLVWQQGGDLLVAPFDPETLVVEGSGYPAVEGVLTEYEGVAHYAFSQAGHLAYLPGGVVEGTSRPVLVHRDGTTVPLAVPFGDYLSPRISPDGKRLIYSTSQPDQSIWMVDLERGATSRFTSEDTSEWWAVWTPDGQRVVYNSTLSGTSLSLFWKPADGSGSPEQLTVSDRHQQPHSWIEAGKILVFTEISQTPDFLLDIFLLRLEGEPKVEPLVTGSGQQAQPIFNADGSWFAYISNETGQFEIYLQRYPGPGGVHQVSIGGGMDPLWSPDSTELYYHSIDGKRVYVVELTFEPELQIGKPELLFEGQFFPGVLWGRTSDLHPDGERFLMTELQDVMIPDRLEIVLDWSTEVQQLAPGEK